MKCFNHYSKDAACICKSCGKGLCPDCAVELPNGMACKGSCEERTKTINAMVDRNKEILSVSNKHIKSAAYTTIVLGLLFGALGVYFFINDKVFGTIYTTIGLVFILSGILKITKKSQYPTQPLPVETPKKAETKSKSKKKS